MRVVLGSEVAQARDILSSLVEQQSGIVVGQAQNAPEAIALTRSLRPDVVILDCHLPHAVGLGQVAMSRAGGLDTAQFILKELPKASVLVVNNLDSSMPAELSLNPGFALYHDNGGSARAPLALWDLPALGWTSPIFTRVSVARASARERLAQVAEESMLFGTAGVLLGLMMIVTGILFVPGIMTILVSGLAIAAGFIGRLLLRRGRQRTP